MHLRCHVSRRTCRFVEQFLRLRHAREAKVRDLQRVFFKRRLLHDQNVFRFHVAVAYAVVVEIEDSPDDLLHGKRTLFLSEALHLLQKIIERTAFAHLQDQIHGCLILKDLVQHEEVGVVNELHDLNLLLEEVPSSTHLLLEDFFHSACGTSCLYSALLDDAKGSLTQNLCKVIVAVDIARVLNDQLQGAGWQHAHRVRDHQPLGEVSLAAPPVRV
mmetsp:Transcript_34316/g.87977  ORF Transcript_34316/g.87977 Transcript_34316/m.87977 type:complete len:216 (-) Transcript_34316:409-1056(-)